MVIGVTKNCSSIHLIMVNFQILNWTYFGTQTLLGNEINRAQELQDQLLESGWNLLFDISNISMCIFPRLSLKFE